MKVLVIGSGPIVIGQAAEFDYAGTQACKALKEEGHEVVLINSNPATIMTDPGVSDALYIEPLTVDFCERVIARERPDALLPTLGGQTGLNLATQLADQGILEKYGVRMLGTPLEAIRKAEDRESFRALMREIREPVPESWIIETPEQLEELLPNAPYPCIVRPAYTLGGTGGGIANTPEELLEIGSKGLKLSMRSQIMVERSLLGWKEVEYEVMRDSKGNCITVCNMENFDPMGVHTGDSIVVAPSQTLSDIEYHMLRTASLKIIRALGIEGGCNVQLAVNPDSFDYYIIEVNPRVSRSSALASKATGYPIARVAAKIAVGKTLDEIDNQVTGTTKACFEPALDYVVVKIPRWPFDKFASGDRTLFTQMKATGEVMAIDRTFEAALMKAIRGLEVKQKDLGGGTAGSAVGILGGPPESSGEVFKRQGAYLPHWTMDGGIYSITYRLADAVPKEVQDEWREEREQLARLKEKGQLSPKDEFQFKKLLSDRINAFLDSGQGSCILREPRVADVVRENLAHFEGARYRVHAWCIMPNHVHVLAQPLSGHDLPDILHSWKSYTSHAINRAIAHHGEVWQTEYYDHLVRDQSDYTRCVDYIVQNPTRAGLHNWPFSGRSIVAEPATIPTGGPPVPPTDALLKAIRTPTDERLWAIAEGLRQGLTVDEVNKLCRVDKWFLRKIDEMVNPVRGAQGANRREARTTTVFKMVDTCAGEFESKTPYYYSSAESEDDSPARDAPDTHGRDARATVLVLGSGPIRIGQGIEFDYSCVHCVWALREMGYRAVIINNNPETVSTDFDTGDGLYFEPVTLNDVLRVVEHENAVGVVCQFGGQTAINLAEGLRKNGIQVLGTSPDAISMAEDREQFDQLLEALDIPRPRGRAVRSLDQAVEVAREVDYPVLVRPSFVLGGRAMEIVYDEEQLRGFYSEAEDANPGQPVLVDQYVLGDEAEVDVISDGEDTLVPGIMEHIERAGVHSGDSMAVYPPVNLSEDVQAQMVRYACRIARALGVKGLMNIQFVIRDEVAYVLEVNPRASRTVPYLSKVTGVPMVDLGTRCMMGEKLKDLGYESGLWTLDPPTSTNGERGHVIPESAFLDGAPSLPDPVLYAVKAPVFSFQKLAKVEPSLGPEMKSTGEVMGVDNTYQGALYKAMIAAGITFKGDGIVLLTVRDEDKEQAVRIGRTLAGSGFRIAATRGTHAALANAGIQAEIVSRITEPERPTPNAERPDGTILDLVLSGQVSLMINTPSADRVAEEEAARIRRACIETGIPCVTSIDTAVALVSAMEIFNDPSQAGCLRLEEYFTPVPTVANVN